VIHAASSIIRSNCPFAMVEPSIVGVHTHKKAEQLSTISS
jgi:hypothetical protein